ncbi:MAG TPA: Gfo/Idh/MocA family oxidoreductase, partial [Herpetosiphonaceae bacterium]
RHVASTVIGSGRADPAREWNWWSDEAQGGGVWGAIGSHQIDTLRYLWGEISAISAALHTFIAERPAEGGPRQVTADDYAAAQVRFASGGLGAIAISVVAAANQPNQLTLHGEDGALRLDGERLLVARRGGDWEDRTPPARQFPPEIQGDFPQATVYLGEALRAWEGGAADALAPAATFGDGLRNQIVLDAGRQSHAEDGRWVAVQG